MKYMERNLLWKLEKKFLHAATCFLVAAMKQIPCLGVAVEVWDKLL